MDRQLTGRLGAELYRAFEKLGADSELLSIVGSLGDTLDDETVIQMLEDWNSGRPQFADVRCAVAPTGADG